MSLSIEPGQLWKYRCLGYPPGVVGRVGHWAVFLVLEVHATFTVAQAVHVSHDWPSKNELLRIRPWGVGRRSHSNAYSEYERVA